MPTMKRASLILCASVCLCLIATFCIMSKTAFSKESTPVRLAPLRNYKLLQNQTRSEILDTATLYKGQGDYESVRICYETILMRNEADPRTSILLGMLYQEQLDDYTKAIFSFRRAVRYISDEDPEAKAYGHRLTAEAYRTLAEKRNSLVYYAQAINEYERVMQFQPDDIEALFFLAVCRLNTLHYDKAIEIFSRIIKKHPKSLWAKQSREAKKVATRERARSR